MRHLLLSIVLMALINMPIQAQEYVELLYNWSDSLMIPSDAYANPYNEVWGFVVNDREFGVLGSTAGTHFFDVTDVDNITEVAFVEGKHIGGDIIHRDYHDYSGYLYAVSDEGYSSLQIIDISNLPESVDVVYDSDSLIIRSHNIFIDTTHAKMYSCNTENGEEVYSDLDVFSLADPVNPQFIGKHEGSGSIHDIYVRDNIAYMNAGTVEGLIVADFTENNNGQIIGTLTDYTAWGFGYNHSGWLSEDGNIYAFADETHGMEVKICDVSDVTDMKILSVIGPDTNENAIPHNLMIRENYLYVSYYYDGLQIFDISDPANPVKASEFDTFEGGSYQSYEGAWGVYSFLPSGNVLVSDMQSGFFVFDVGYTPQEPTNPSSIEDHLAVSPFSFNTLVNEQLKIKTQFDRAQSINLEIFDMKGGLLLSQDLDFSAGERIQILDVVGLQSGNFYLVKASADSEVFTGKFYKK